MDKRNFPGSISQATMLTSQALRETTSFAQTSDQRIVEDIITGHGGLLAFVDSTHVHAQTIPDMTVAVEPFAAYGGTPVMHGLGFNKNLANQDNVVISDDDAFDAKCTVTIEAASAVFPRRDLICFQIQEIDLNYASNNVQTIQLAAINPSTGNQTVPTEFYPNTIQRVAIRYVQGVAQTTPALPNVPAGWTALAEIYVAANATTITNSDITFIVPRLVRGYNLQRANLFINQGMVYVEERGLTCNIAPYRANIAGTVYESPTVANLLLTASSTNYVYINNAGTLTSNTNGFPSFSIPLATVVCGSTTITSITDKRSWLNMPGPASGGGGEGGGGGDARTVILNELHGFQIQYDTATTIVINPGYCLDSTGTVEMYLESPVVVDITTTGANGRQSGQTETALQCWNVYVIHKTSDNSVAGFLSTSETPTLPAGYDYYRWVGFVANNASSNFEPFDWTGYSNAKSVLYRSSVIVVSAASFASSFTWYDGLAYPYVSNHPNCRWGLFSGVHQQTAVSNQMSSPDYYIRPKGETDSIRVFGADMANVNAIWGTGSHYNECRVDSNGYFQIANSQGGVTGGHCKLSVYVEGARCTL